MSKVTALACRRSCRTWLTLRVMTVRASAVDSAVDLGGQNPYWKSLRRLFFVRWPRILCQLINASKSLLMTLRRLIGWYWEGTERSPAFYKTGQSDESFHISGKRFSSRQQLKSFARIGDNFGLMCFRTTTGISSGPVALVESSFLTSFPISLEVTENLLSRQSVSWGKSGRGWPCSSRVELAAKFAANNFAFSDEEEMTSGPFTIVEMEGFPLFKTFLEIFQSPSVPGLSLLISVRTDSMTVLSISENAPALITCCIECCMGIVITSVLVV